MSAPRLGPRTLAGLVVGLTFVVGVLSGAVLDRGFKRASATVVPPTRHGPAGPPGSARDRVGREQHRERFVQQLTRELSLNPQQVARIDAITLSREQRMNAFWQQVQPQIHALLDATRAEINQVLTPEQRAKLQDLRRQREARERMDTGSVRDTTSGKR